MGLDIMDAVNGVIGHVRYCGRKSKVDSGNGDSEVVKGVLVVLLAVGTVLWCSCVLMGRFVA